MFYGLSHNLSRYRERFAEKTRRLTKVTGTFPITYPHKKAKPTTKKYTQATFPPPKIVRKTISNYSHQSFSNMFDILKHLHVMT